MEAPRKSDEEISMRLSSMDYSSMQRAQKQKFKFKNSNAKKPDDLYKFGWYKAEKYPDRINLSITSKAA